MTAIKEEQVEMGEEAEKLRKSSSPPSQIVLDGNPSKTESAEAERERESEIGKCSTVKAISVNTCELRGNGELEKSQQTSSIKTFDEMPKRILAQVENGNGTEPLNQLQSQQEIAVAHTTDVNDGPGQKSDEQEESGCPLEIVMEFLENVMLKNYKKALKLAKEVIQHEPDNKLVKEYLEVLGGLTALEKEEKESESEEEDSSSSGKTSSIDSWESVSDDEDAEKSDESSSSSSDEDHNKSVKVKVPWKP